MIPPTVNQCPPSHTRPPGRVTPSALAASVPSTVTGYRLVATLRKRPATMCPWRVASRRIPAAYTVMPLLLAAGTWSLRYTLALTSPTADAAWTGPIRATMAGAVAGKVTFGWPNELPGVTVSRFVPRESISATTCARLEAEMPSTATMVAMPRAIPSADSTARAGRVASPAAASGTASAARIRLRGRPGGRGGAAAPGRRPVTGDHRCQPPSGRRVAGCCAARRRRPPGRG